MKLITEKISFHINGFWFHLEMDGNIGTDQHGDRWIRRGNKLYAEHNSNVSSRYPDENVQIDQMIYNQY